MSDAPHGPLVFGVPDEGGPPPPAPPPPCYAAVSGGAGRIVLPPNAWVRVPFNVGAPLPARNLAQLLAPDPTPGILVPDPTCDGDYKLSFGLTLTMLGDVFPGADWVGAVISINGAPDAGGVALRPTLDWHDVSLDILDVPMFGLQGKTMWPLIAGDEVGLYLFASGLGQAVGVNTTDLDVHRLAPPVTP